MRKIWDIPGGIHPPENKHQSLGQSIGSLPMPSKLVLPLNQHIGAPAKPVVNVGDTVLKGQLIASAEGFVSAPVHAPTSGQVTAIEPQLIPHSSGMTAPCIIISPDGHDQWQAHKGVDDYKSLPATQLLNLIRDAGIAGMGGAGFPSAVKLSPQQAIDTLIINGTECEPYITADDILMQERAEDIISGIEILAHILGNPTTIMIGIEDNKASAFDALVAAGNNSHVNIDVVEFPTKYPSGGEKQLIQILTGKEVTSGKLPAHLGIVCQNIGTVHAIYRAISIGEPLISRITTVTGKACGINRNYEVLLGTPVSHLLAHNDLNKKQCTRLVMGGPMMGFTLADPDVPVIKTTNCILACDSTESPRYAPQQPCIRCGICAEACPASLLPQQLYWYSQAKDYDKIQAHNLFDCIECGACAYVCPSTIPLVQYYRAAKGEIRTLNIEKSKSDHARERFENHKARVEKAAADKAAKREARRLAAEKAKLATAAKHTVKSEENTEANTPAPTNAADDLIKAAMARAAARQASPEQQQAKLNRAVNAAQNRVDFAQQKLEEAQTSFSKENSADDPQNNTSSDERHPVTEEFLEKLRVKVEQARLKLADTTEKRNVFDAAAATDPPTDTPSTETSPPAIDPATADDPASAAIAKAIAKASAQAALSPRDKLTASIESLQKRIAKSKSKLATAEQEGSEHIDALNNGLKKLENKLASAEAELNALNSGAKTP